MVRDLAVALRKRDTQGDVVMLQCGKAVRLLGIAFSSTGHTVQDWKEEVWIDRQLSVWAAQGGSSFCRERCSLAVSMFLNIVESKLFSVWLAFGISDVRGIPWLIYNIN